jgi:hypothetical protein
VANAVYPKWKAAQQKALAPDLSSGAVNVKMILVDTGQYTYSATHEFLSDVPSGARVAISGNVANKTVAAGDGTLDCDDFALTSVSGLSVEAVIFYYDTGTAGTSRLICYMDTGVTGLPLTPNGGDVNVTINASGIFTP